MEYGSGVLRIERMTANVLNSWKEIAHYLGRGVRTVQRWERDLGLPVRRPRGRSRSAVIAIPSELDQWLRARHPAMPRKIDPEAIERMRKSFASLQSTAESLRQNAAMLRKELDHALRLAQPIRNYQRKLAA